MANPDPHRLDTVSEPAIAAGTRPAIGSGRPLAARPLPRHSACALLFVVLAGLLAACSGTERSAESFCEQLGVVTGSQGAEVTVIPGDPDRVGAVADELRVLLERAPDDISTPVRTLLSFFDEYQQVPRDGRRELVTDRHEELQRASERLDDYALQECGLFLARAEPTAVQAVDPGIQVPDE